MITAPVAERLRTGRKVCTSCRTEKDLDDFAACRRNADGRAYYCRRCFSDRFGKKRRQRQPVS